MKEIYKPYLINIEVKENKDIDANRYPFNLPVVKTSVKLCFILTSLFLSVRMVRVNQPYWKLLPSPWGLMRKGGRLSVHFSTVESVSPLLILSYPNARIYQFDETGVARVDYEETECFRLMRDFLNNYDRRLQQLLDKRQDFP
ncbi:hypothetical protein [Brenneria goodwinii]